MLKFFGEGEAKLNCKMLVCWYHNYLIHTKNYRITKAVVF